MTTSTRGNDIIVSHDSVTGEPYPRGTINPESIARAQANILSEAYLVVGRTGQEHRRILVILEGRRDSANDICSLRTHQSRARSNRAQPQGSYDHHHADPTALPEQLPRRIPSTLCSTTQSPTQHILLRRSSSIHTDDLDIVTTNVKSTVTELQLVRYLQSETYTSTKAERIQHSSGRSTTFVTSRTTVPCIATQCKPANTSTALSTFAGSASVRTTEQAAAELSYAAGIAGMGRSLPEVETRER